MWGGQSGAAAEEGGVAVVIVKTGHLKFRASSDLSLGGKLFVPATFHDRAPASPQQGREGIQLIERGRQFAADLPLVGLERRGGARLLGQDQSGAPVVGEPGIELQARTQGSGRLG